MRDEILLDARAKGRTAALKMQPRSHADSKPALQLGMLCIWVDGRQFPESQDAWDGNWLNIRVVCDYLGARVVMAGSYLDTVSFWSFGEGLKRVYKNLSGEAVLESVEPLVKASIVALGETGLMELRIEMRPDPVNQRHWFRQELDQSYLPAAINECEEVLRQYPIRDAAGRRLDQ
jgi:hypothetical protein